MTYYYIFFIFWKTLRYNVLYFPIWMKWGVDYINSSTVKYKQDRTSPANIRLDEDVFRLRLQKTSWRRLDHNRYVRLSLMSSEDVLVKTKIFVLAIRLQDVFKTSSRCLEKHLQDIFKTSSRRLQDIFEASSKDVFKTFSTRIIKLNCSC